MLPLLLYAERDRGQWKITQFGLQKHIGFNASHSTSSAMLTVQSWSDDIMLDTHYKVSEAYVNV